MTAQVEKVTKGAATRAMLVSAALDIVQAEGIGAVTARRLADKLGLKRQIVHYHFGTIDDVLLEVMQHGFKTTCEAVAKALEHDDPFDVIWKLFSRTTPEAAEFLAIALRNEAFGAAMRIFSNDLHALLGQALAKDYERRGVAPPANPTAIAQIIQATAQAIGWEAALGQSSGHNEVKSLLRNFARPTPR
jgi:TetR/AcrR family transcriptional regulator